jgi:hypothetical protein
MAQVFQGLVLARKWRKTHQDIQVNDLVLMKKENTAGVVYQRGRVKTAFSREDGQVRSVEIEYKNPSEQVFMTTTQPIKKLVMLIPVDYRHEINRTRKQLNPDKSQEGRHSCFVINLSCH